MATTEQRSYRRTGDTQQQPPPVQSQSTAVQTNGNTNRGLATQTPSPGTLNGFLEKMKPQFERALPKHMTVDRLMRVALTTINKNPDLGKCSVPSLLSCILDCAQLGLEPDNVLGRAYLIPYGNTCTLIIGYKGLVELAMRSGRVSTLMAQVVHEKDQFDYEFGPESFLRHKPSLDVDPGEVTAAYAYAKFKDGSYAFDVMSTAQIERIRQRSKSKNKGPWVTDWDEMARKTVLKRLSKYLPLSPEFMDGVSRDNEYESEPSRIVHPVFKDEKGNVLVKAEEATFTDKEASDLLAQAKDETADETTGEIPDPSPEVLAQAEAEQAEELALH